jgi:DNA polymerase-3 subunit epsilon
LKVLLDSARAPSFRLWANNSPFETKDVLRKRGYWWDAVRRCWSCEVRSQARVQEELAWLRDAVYAGKSVAIEQDEFDAKSRYSGREGQRTVLRTS